ncbi:class I SAM-dependent methyltransferase [Streptacidiphilus jiangxiensis]|uniref:Methyltransferase domain-containing protein n=1 Tax=Streptacidiphilus jiangxiensis TaxID=235985 RepID=A0A1H7U4E7_STRJI|nr:class I SAM-dependent methyltransferase [Streptacidiphilus jiangxiensis]SEL91639.1 Methyltransferase domain-containing protein [Streptacidiphilus jiangxiensis]
MTAETAEIISYQAPDTADDYRRWDDSASWLLGYSFLPLALGLTEGRATRLLDLGCGPGDVTRWLAERSDAVITAVDSSAAMIDFARADAPHPRIDYRHSEDGLPFLADGSMDAAMACFLFTCVDDESTIRDLITEVARVVRPGGRFTILVPNPDHASGAEFEGFRRGDAGAAYRAGELMPVHVQRTDGTWTTITNRYWTRETYRTALTKAGFEGPVRELAPVHADAVDLADPELFAGRAWIKERTAAPFLLITAVK